MEKQTLSSKIEYRGKWKKGKFDIDYVKEFIKKIKYLMSYGSFTAEEIAMIINEEAGDKLI